MKSYIIVLYALLLAAVLTACSKILDKPPLDRITDQQMTFSAAEMKLYANQFYVDFPGWKKDEYTGGIFWNDLPSDNMVHGSYNYNAQVSGTITIPSSGGDWNWSKIRAVNYFLANYQITTDPPANVNRYIGEIYFWRAWYYFGLMKKYGDLPWYNRPLTTSDMDELTAPRLSRSVIADSILQDLNNAISLLPAPASAEALRINRGTALAFKTRVALYEGTWEKYHAGTPFGVTGGDPNKYFRAVASAAEELMTANYYQIPAYSATPKWNYWRIFNQKDLSGNKEIIQWSKFDKALGLTHNGQNMLPWEGSNTGVSKQLVDCYLASDGKPISVSPLYLGDDSITQAVTNRDPRLAQTIYVRNAPRRITGTDTVKFTEPDINLAPNLRSTTGYMIFKGSAPDDADRTGAVTANIVFRYAEVLLNYAEAKAELGEATQTVLDQTINVLRDRVQMPHLTVGVGFTDPKWEFPALSPLLNEIRRERRVELALEGFRLDDLMRWRAHHLLQRPLTGAKYSQFAGKPFNPPLNNILVNGDGYIFPYLNTPAVNGWQFDPSKHYLLPLPTNEIVLNPQMKQNPGYQ